MKLEHSSTSLFNTASAAFMLCILWEVASVVLDSATPWAVVHRTPLSIGLSRQEYWSGSPCPPPGNLPDTEIQPTSLCLLHWRAGPLPLAPPGKPHVYATRAELNVAVETI